MGKRAAIGVSVTAALVVGYTAADVFDVVPGVLTTAPEQPTQSAPHVPKLDQAPADPVLPGASGKAPVPTRKNLAKALKPLLKKDALGKKIGFEVRDAKTGKALFSHGGSRPHTPASVTKLLTASAALEAIGPRQRFTTKVLQGPGKDEITLQAGGDVLLGRKKSRPSKANGHAGLSTLAAKTARQLKKSGRKTVAVRLDTSIFTGPRTNDAWADDSVKSGFIAPIAPLMVDTGKVDPKSRRRAADPAMWAAKLFSSRLEDDGIKVVGKPARMTAQTGSEVLAKVTSARLRRIVRYMLQNSDNTVAEVLGRLVAVQTGKQGSFADAIDAVIGEVKKLGVEVDDVILHDVSGLSHQNRLTASVLTELLIATSSGEHPELASVIPSLPVAGLNGTLRYRYGAKNAAGAGLVHAKTGSLLGVSSLAGAVTDSSGRLLVFALLADKTPVAAVASTHRAIDRVATRLVRCGCAG